MMEWSNKEKQKTQTLSYVTIQFRGKARPETVDVVVSLLDQDPEPLVVADKNKSVIDALAKEILHWDGNLCIGRRAYPTEQAARFLNEIHIVHSGHPLATR